VRIFCQLPKTPSLLYRVFDLHQLDGARLVGGNPVACPRERDQQSASEEHKTYIFAKEQSEYASSQINQPDGDRFNFVIVRLFEYVS
jgi:hypothetical protein